MGGAVQAMLGRLSVVCVGCWLVAPVVLEWDGIGGRLASIGLWVFFLQAEGVKMSSSGLSRACQLDGAYEMHFGQLPRCSWAVDYSQLLHTVQLHHSSPAPPPLSSSSNPPTSSPSPALSPAPPFSSPSPFPALSSSSPPPSRPPVSPSPFRHRIHCDNCCYSPSNKQPRKR